MLPDWIRVEIENKQTAEERLAEAMQIIEKANLEDELSKNMQEWWSLQKSEEKERETYFRKRDKKEKDKERLLSRLTPQERALLK